MKTTKLVALAVLLIATGALFTAQAQEHPTKTEHPTKMEHPTKTEHPAKMEHPAPAELAAQAGDILVVAAGAGEFKTLLAAIEAAGLAEQFQGKGPFTIFAPTDAAFAKLPAGTVEDLLKPANKAKLAGLLADHVVPGIIMAADLKTMKAANIGGHDLDILVNDDHVMVNNARVAQADLMANNGIIHAIDAVIVLVPSESNADSKKPMDHPGH